MQQLHLQMVVRRLRRMLDPIRSHPQRRVISVAQDPAHGQLLKQVRTQYQFLDLQVARLAIPIALLHRVVVVRALILLVAPDLVTQTPIVFYLIRQVRLVLQFLKRRKQITLSRILLLQVLQLPRHVIIIQSPTRLMVTVILLTTSIQTARAMLSMLTISAISPELLTVSVLVTVL